MLDVHEADPPSFKEKIAEQIVEMLFKEILEKRTFGYTRTLNTAPTQNLSIEISMLPENLKSLQEYYKNKILEVLERPLPQKRGGR